MKDRHLTEAEVRTRRITPALQRAGWAEDQIREEFSSIHGRIIVRDGFFGRGERRRADYVLEYKSGLSLTVVEAKDNAHAVGGGMQQALAYAEALQAPFVFTLNGDGFLFHDPDVDRRRRGGTLPDRPEARRGRRETAREGAPRRRLQADGGPIHTESS